MLCVLGLSAASSSEAHAQSWETVVAGGRHRRLETEHGPIHLWRPGGYEREGAGIVIYIHGYFIDADRAFSEHHLAEQFDHSRRNAVFVVPEAPADKNHPVRWPTLGPLLAEIGHHFRLPDGPLVVVGHSGAYRTMSVWHRFRRLDQMILLDALYGGDSEFKAFLRSVPGHTANRLVLVDKETTEHVEHFLSEFPSAIRRWALPNGSGGLRRSDRVAQIVAFRSQYDHLELVTSGEVLPVLLRLSPLATLPIRPHNPRESRLRTQGP